MDVVSVDLDDTLIETGVKYERAKEWFGDYVTQNFDVGRDEAVDRYTELSSGLLDEYGLSKHRFPQAAVEALKSLVDDHSEEEKRRAYEIGRSAFKNKDQYMENGFIENGVKEFLQTVDDVSDLSILVTAGDPHIQNRKIDALGLRDYFDRIEVVDMNGKTAVLEEFNDGDGLVHIGNSNHSDVRAASNADADCIYIPRGEWMDGDNEYDGGGQIYTVDGILEAEKVLTDLFSD